MLWLLLVERTVAVIGWQFTGTAIKQLTTLCIRVISAHTLRCCMLGHFSQLHCWDCVDCTIDLSSILLRFSEPVLVVLLVFLRRIPNR